MLLPTIQTITSIWFSSNLLRYGTKHWGICYSWWDRSTSYTYLTQHKFGSLEYTANWYNALLALITSSYAFHAASTQTRALGPISHIVMICTLNRDHSSVNKKVLNIEGLALLVSSPNIIIRSLSLSLSLSYLTSEDDNTIYLSLSTVEKMYRSIDLSIYLYVCVSISPSWSNNDSVESFLSGWTEWDGCIGRHSFCSLTNANECVCYQNILMFFFSLFTLTCKHFKKNYLTIENEYKCMVFTSNGHGSVLVWFQGKETTPNRLFKTKTKPNHLWTLSI